MRRDPDLLMGAGLAGLSTVTGVWAVRAAQTVPKRTHLDRPLDRGGEMFVHLILVLGATIWLVSRLARRVRLRPSIAGWMRGVGWVLLLVFFAANAQHHDTAGHTRDLLLAATTIVLPLWPALVGGLLFDLGLFLVYEGKVKPAEGFDAPSSVVCAGLYGGLAPLAFVGALALANFGAEFFAPPFFEALAFDTVWLLLLFALATPVALLWLLISAGRGVWVRSS